jgi:hypothetical protein
VFSHVDNDQTIARKPEIETAIILKPGVTEWPQAIKRNAVA